MKIKPGQVEVAMKAGSSLLLFGPDTGAVTHFARHCIRTFFGGQEATLFLGEEIAKNPDILIEKMEASLFGNEKVIRIVDVNEAQGKVIEKILRRNTNLCVLIEAGSLTAKNTIRRHFEYAKHDFYAIAFYSPIEKKSWFREEAIKYKLPITDDALELLSQYSSQNSAFNRQSLLKLSIAFPGEQITKEHALKILEDHSISTLWDSYHACILKEKVNLEQVMDSYTPIGFLRGLSRHIQNILEEKRIGKIVSNTLFFHRQSMKKQKSVDEKFLIRALALSMTAEALCKKGRQNQREICKNAAAEISGSASNV